MKTAKNFTTGVALLLCILVCIYVLTLYLKFKPNEEPEILEDGTVEEVPGKLEQFLDSEINAKEHLVLAFLLAFSSAAGYALGKVPSIGMFTSAVTLAYALTMFRYDGLPKFPMTVISLCFVHAAGAVFYAATSERGRKHSFLGMNSAASGAILCQSAALGMVIYIYPILERVSSLASKVQTLSENSINVNVRFVAMPRVLDFIWRAYENGGQSQARIALTHFTKQYETEGIQKLFEQTYVGGEIPVYVKLGILLFAAIILSLVFRKKPIVGVVLSALPTLYIFGNMMYDKISTATLILLSLTLFGAIGAFAAYQRDGAPALVDANGEEIAVIEEDDPEADELPAYDAVDDTEGESVTDWECDKLDYFYERPTPTATNDDITPAERDEYLEIKETDDGNQKESSK